MIIKYHDKITKTFYETDDIEFVLNLIYGNENIELIYKDKKQLQEIKELFSSFYKIMPLFDIKSKQIYLINYKNVYERILVNNYRFLTDTIRKKFLENNLIKGNVNFLKYYDFDILQKTYYKVLYKSFKYNNFITSCYRSSFDSHIEHIKPYYTSKELLYFGLDWGLITKEEAKTKYNDNFYDLCVMIKDNDINGETLKNHQKYISDTNSINAIKFYSLFGSYFLNKYLRNKEKKNSNSMFEYNIKYITNVIKKSPPLKTEKSNVFIVYRFIENDSFLNDIKIGEHFIEKGFMSATRNPFFKLNDYVFGYILMKIVIPVNKKGVGLCIEGYSNFPEEEEIIFAPNSKFELIKLDIINSKEDNEYDFLLEKTYNKRYTFKYIETENLDSYENLEKINIKTLDMDKYFDYNKNNVDDKNSYTLMHNLLKFIGNLNNQFFCVINNDKLLFNIQPYDSTSVYKPYFALSNKHGLMLYVLNKTYGGFDLIIEIGENEMHINYYFKYSLKNEENKIDLENKEWIIWLCKLAFILNINEIFIYPTYKLASNKKHTYIADVYDYLKYGKVKYKNYEGIKSADVFYGLDVFKKRNVTEIVNINNKNELYQIYANNMDKITTIADMYIYVTEQCPFNLKILEEQMFNINGIDTLNDVRYIINVNNFLLNNKIIYNIPNRRKIIKMNIKNEAIIQKIPKFNNRIRNFLE